MTVTADQLIADVRELAPRIAARASEIEARRTVPTDIIDQLRDIGVFRMITPKAYGGLELSLPDFASVITAVAAADGSVGWAVMIGCGTALLYSRLPKKSFDEIFAQGPDVIQAGTVHGMGAAEIVDGGYRVTGRWPFASGSPHADWILGGCKIMKNGEPVLGPNGQPIERIVTLPASAWTIEDTWHVSGLRGSGSNHVSIKDTFVPEGMVFDLAGPSCIEGPFYGSVGAIIPFFHAAFADGIAEGAHADICALAGTGKQQYRTRAAMREQPIFQYELGRAQGDLRAARAYLKTQADSHWQRALSGTLGDPAAFFDAMQMNVWVTEAATRVVDKCYTLGGGTSLYDSSPLQRRLRDIHTATQHMVSSQRHYTSAGALAIGMPPTSFA
ncbi:MAG TPA: acyl-CoA dehydrogenase family protein [Alphaproteobacteria bacterium]|nr:acyl-CoA dehydrogenase family protein [Alphaproteobacteria bacterium]